MGIYQGQNVQQLLVSLNDTKPLHHSERPFVIAQVVSEYISQNEGMSEASFMELLKAMMGFNLEHGYFARRQYTLKELLHGRLKNRLLLHRIQVVLDNDDGLYRTAVTQIARREGLFFFYSTDLVISDTEVALREIRQKHEERSLAQERQQAALAPTLASNLRSSFVSVREQVLEFVEGDYASLLLVESSGRIAFANTKARAMFAKRHVARDDEGLATLVGTSVHDLTPLYIREAHKEKLTQFFKKPSRAVLGTRRPLKAVRVDGSEFRCAISLDLLDTGGETLVATRLYDISNQAEQEDKFNEFMNETMTTSMEAEMKSLADFSASLEGALVVVNIKSEIVEGNDAACRLLACDRSFLLSNPLHTFVPAYVRQSHEMHVRNFFDDSTIELGGKGDQRVFPAQTCDGKEVNVGITIKKLQLRDQWLALALLTPLEPVDEAARLTEDFTLKFNHLRNDVRRRVDVAKTREMPQLQAFLDACSESAIAVSHLGGIVALNPATCAVFGYEKEELLGRPIDILTPDHVQYDHYDKVRSFFSNASSRTLGQGRQLTARHKSGEEFPVQISLDVFLMSSGNVAMARIHDLTASLSSTARANAIMEKQLEARATLEDSLLANFLTNCGRDNDAAMVVNNKGMMIMVSDVACEMFGYNREELVGFSIDMLTPRSIRAMHSRKVAYYFLDPMPRLMSGASGSNLSLKAAHKSGAEFPVRIALNHLDTRHGTVATCIVQDLRQVQLLVDEVEKSRERDEVDKRERNLVIDKLIRKNPWIQATMDGV